MVEDDAHFLFLKEVLGVPAKKILCAGTVGEIFKLLRKRGPVKGVADEDPGSSRPRDLRSLPPFGSPEDRERFERLEVDLRGAGRGNRVLIFRPRFEEWLLKAAKEARIDVGDFGFSDKASDLHTELMGIKGTEKAQKFSRLLRDLCAKSRKVEELKAFLRERDC